MRASKEALLLCSAAINVLVLLELTDDDGVVTESGCNRAASVTFTLSRWRSGGVTVATATGAVLAVLLTADDADADADDDNGEEEPEEEEGVMNANTASSSCNKTSVGDADAARGTSVDCLRWCFSRVSNTPRDRAPDAGE